MRFDRKIFFDLVREDPFSGELSQPQVDGMEAILGRWEDWELGQDVRHLAYMLATTFHETAATMQPITEYGSQSYLEGKDYYPYIGRGYVQLTWKDNYEKASLKLNIDGTTDDLVVYPDRALDPEIAADVMFYGMSEGWFTGKKLSGYFNDSKDDPLNARQIINGNDDDELIRGYHNDFLAALEAAWRAEPLDPLEPVEPVDPEIVFEMVDINVQYSATSNVIVTLTINGEKVELSGKG